MNCSIELLEIIGNELTIINIHNNTEKNNLEDSDKILLKNLYENKNLSAFHHVLFRFRIKGPNNIIMQLYKHIVEISYKPIWTECNDNTAIWTCTLPTVLNFIELRNKINVVPQMVLCILQKNIPVIFNIWFNASICK